MSGSLQNIAAILALASALAAPAACARDADDPNGLWLGGRFDPFGAREYLRSTTERNASAGATLHAPSGWTASLFVSSFRPDALQDDTARLKPSSFVNARLSRKLSKNTRVSFDVFNIFDRRADNADYFSTSRAWNQPGASDNFLFNPAEPRGFRIKLRTAF